MTLSPKVWSDALRLLQQKIPNFAFDTWIAPLAVRAVRHVDDDDGDGDGDGANTQRSHHVTLGCPTSFHRDRVRVNYAELIGECFEAAVDGSGGIEAAASHDRPMASTIAFVTMQEFDAAPGIQIEVQLPARQEAAAQSGLRKVASSAGVQASQAASGGGVTSVLGHPGFVETAPPPRTAPLRAVPERNRRQSTTVDASRTARDGASDAGAGAVIRQARARRDTSQPELPFSF
ncbi:MAG: hypothetical protein VCB25_01960, partial [Myxococcota bacterium]